jgi:subfamily B ATP-binding cassette protein HlyB/CyaB
MSSFGGTIHRDELLRLLGSLSGRYHLPFDAALVAQSFSPPYDHAVLHEAARSLGFKAGTRATAGLDWQKLPLPAVGFLLPAPETRPPPAPDSPSVDQATAEATDPLAHTLLIILKIEGEKLFYFRIGSQAPETITTDEEEVIPGFPVEKKPFGFSWFIPELLKHKKSWRDILFASLAIQLVGLTTPLFTQVIIDKVIARQSRSILIVLGFALIMFMLFNVTMTWLRQYLVLHTGNRIDAVLGSKLFRHLLRLPENRPTGTLVARMQGVETIRQFVSGAAVTLILDLPFLLIFLAVMFAYSWQLSLIVLGFMSLICLISFLMVPHEPAHAAAGGAVAYCPGWP